MTSASLTRLFFYFLNKKRPNFKDYPSELYWFSHHDLIPDVDKVRLVALVRQILLDQVDADKLGRLQPVEIFANDTFQVGLRLWAESDVKGTVGERVIIFK